MNRMRLSYSLIDTWLRGGDVISLYYRLDRDPTPQMQEGKEIHETIAEHVEKTKEFPKWFFNYPLRNPETEKEVIVRYNDVFDLKCIIDLLDEPLIFEYKTGVSDSLSWSTKDQLPFYLLACELAGINVDSAFLVRFNQYAKKTDFTIVHNHKGLIDHARNVIDSYAPEIYEFFNKEGIL